jgi:hypothetical protein
MKPNSPSHSATLLPARSAALLTFQAIGLVIAYLVISSAARAQGATASPAPSTTVAPATGLAPPAAGASALAPVESAEAEPEYAHPLQVGDATQNLFAWQRSGVIASSTPRPIPGDIAYRSYERYLKSFEFPIPEHLNSSVKSPSTK